MTLPLPRIWLRTDGGLPHQEGAFRLFDVDGVELTDNSEVGLAVSSIGVEIAVQRDALLVRMCVVALKIPRERLAERLGFVDALPDEASVSFTAAWDDSLALGDPLFRVV